MHCMPVLLYHPTMYEDECPIGYLTRVALSNGYSGYASLLSAMGMSWKNQRAPTRTIVNGEFNYKHIFECCGLRYVKPLLASIHNDTILTISTPYLVSVYPRICPHCIKEFGYIKAIWSFMPITCCLKHGELLIDALPHSRGRLNWNRNELVPYGVQDTPPTLPDKQSLLASRFFESKILQTNNLDSPAILQGLSALEALTLIHFVLFCIHKTKKTERFNLNSQSVSALNTQYAVVWKILKRWPRSFHELLSEVRNKPDQEKGIAGIRKHYRDIYDKLFRGRNYPGLQPVYVAFTDFISRDPEFIRDQYRIKRIEIDETFLEIKWLKFTEAARFLNNRRPRIYSLIDQGKLKAKGIGHYTYVSETSLIQWKSIVETNMTFQEFCSDLAISKNRALQILNAGLVKVHQKPSNENRGWIIDKVDVDRFIQSLIANHIEPTSAKSLPLTALYRMGLNFGQVVKKIKSGSIRCHFEKDKTNSHYLSQFSCFQPQ